MEKSFLNFRKAVNERNRASEMALSHAVSILTDFRELTPKGRKLMVDILVKLISEEKKEVHDLMHNSLHGT